MEYIDGRNFYEFLSDDPLQDLRNHFGSLITRSHCRFCYAGRRQYADPHPGHYLFLENGRLGLIDFGCMRPFNDEEWKYLRLANVGLLGSREDVVTALKQGTEKRIDRNKTFRA